MPLLPALGRRSLRARATVAAMYLVLIAGAATMLWPLAHMIGGSFRGLADQREGGVVPGWLHDDDALWRRYVEGLFQESLDLAAAHLDMDAVSLESFPVPAPAPALVQAWNRFLDERPEARLEALGFLRADVSKSDPRALREFRNALIRRFEGDIARMNREWGLDIPGWGALYVPIDDLLSRRNPPIAGPFRDARMEFQAACPAWMRHPFSVEGFFRRVVLRARYGRDESALRRAYGDRIRSFGDVPLPTVAPPGGAARNDWVVFVRDVLPPRFVRLDGRVPTIVDLAEAPLERLALVTPESQFRDWLRERYGPDPAAAGAALGIAAADWADIRAPLAAAQYERFAAARSELRREFAARNFRTVLDHVVRHGRGARNTVIYCALAVLAALLVNPLAAYALSRFRPRSAYLVLLMLMLTMAFPSMVTQIPAFLMLRDLGLLNTFAALILPGLANGYSIFLLKGYFDSLPREMYESAELDGAGEWTIFWTMTMALSRPILAVIALHAFTAAYSNFMFALLICQDERMWTLMVWLYELQNRSGTGVVHASLLLAAVPSLLAFLVCQRFILRGLVIPVER